MSKVNPKYNKTRHEFLLTLFPDQLEKYSVIYKNGFVLVRQFNGNTKRWEVAIYTKESWNNSLYWRKSSPPNTKKPRGAYRKALV